MKNLAKERTRGEKQDNFKRLVHEVENIDDKVAADLNDSFQSRSSFDKDQIEEEEDEKPYKDQAIDDGHGKIRIGFPIELEQGVYSLLFISNFSRVYLAKTLEKKKIVQQN